MRVDRVNPAQNSTAHGFVPKLGSCALSFSLNQTTDYFGTLVVADRQVAKTTTTSTVEDRSECKQPTRWQEELSAKFKDPQRDL